MRYTIFKISFLIVLLFSSGFACMAKTDKPNIILIFIDDMGYGDLGTYGSEIPTPNLDQMAEEGVKFTNFYVAQAVCSASRAALLTGTYSNRVGIHGALDHMAKHGLNPEETTIAEMLKPKGYRTAIFGKWHLGHHPEFLPTNQGFDEFYGIP
jgi:arylsulfatase